MSTELADTSYTSDNIKTLKDAAHIRQNPGMYIGNTDTEGLHHLVYELVYNSVDEALAGYCKHITRDDPRRWLRSPSATTAAASPSDVKADTGKSTLEEVLTIVGHVSGKFDNAAYRVAPGCTAWAPRR